jgi:hypothetical protein
VVVCDDLEQRTREWRVSNRLASESLANCLSYGNIETAERWCEKAVSLVSLHKGLVSAERNHEVGARHQGALADDFRCTCTISEGDDPLATTC